MEKENVLEIEFQKVWDMWAWRVIKNKLQMKDNEFFIEANTKLMLKVGYKIDEYIICTEANYKGVGEYELITNEEKKYIENFINLVNQKYGIPKRWRAEENEEYFYIGETGLVRVDKDNFSYGDNMLYNLGNYFKTKEEAQKVVDSKEWQEFWEKVRNGEIGGDE
ncbi:hypothetical protein CI111_02910 [Fusobacterium animalis]|uniref:Uncharacterized protein n=1 Tax=Fusobacterium animalis TaxID=76859 RepID=A0A2G9FNI4_9FUSO|nr:hypothetical protein [Fusobacterium animalis]PIM93100.1 hypothetical protein CI114_02790 [Fusobacterium animalis]PIM94274.1 hypothetical protein CI111_02910 [Fusobacterium animalis]